MLLADNFHSPDMFDDRDRLVLPDSWTPRSNDIYSLLQFDVRDEDDHAGSGFSVVVATESALVARSKAIGGRGLILIERYNFDEIQSSIQDICAACFVPDDLAASFHKLNEHFFWDYENIREVDLDDL